MCSAFFTLNLQWQEPVCLLPVVTNGQKVPAGLQERGMDLGSARRPEPRVLRTTGRHHSARRSYGKANHSGQTCTCNKNALHDSHLTFAQRRMADEHLAL